MRIPATVAGDARLRTVGLVLFVVALVGAMSAPGAARDALWGDEVASARVLSEPSLGGVIGRVQAAESTPPAWYVGSWAAQALDARLTAGALLGEMERLRTVSLLATCVAAVLVALWTLGLFNDRLLAAVAGTLIATGSTPVAYAGQLRAYALFMALSAAFGLVLVSTAASPGGRLLATLALCTWLGLMTHYFFTFAALAGVVWLVVERLRGRTRALIAISLAGAAYLPWLPSLMKQRGHERYGWIGGFDPRTLTELPGQIFVGADGFAFGLGRLANMAMLLAGTVVLLRRAEGRAIVMLALVPLSVAGLLWLLGEPIVNERNMLVIAPFIAIAVAASLTLLDPGRRAAAVAAIVLMTLGAWFVDQRTGRPPYDQIAQSLIASGWTATDPIAIAVPRAETSMRVALGWYLPGQPRLAPLRGRCTARFTVGHSALLNAWLEHNRGRVEAERRFPFFDHPSRGRPLGEVIVIRTAEGLTPPLGAYVSRGARVGCYSGSKTSTAARTARPPTLT